MPLPQPNAARHDPSLENIRRLIERSGLTQAQLAERLGMSTRAFRYYLTGGRPMPYVVQYCLECLPEKER